MSFVTFFSFWHQESCDFQKGNQMVHGSRLTEL